MIAKRMLPALCAGLLCLVGLAGCGPASTSAPVAQEGSATTAVTTTAEAVAAAPSDATATADATADGTATGAVESNLAETGDMQTMTSTVESAGAPEGAPGQTEPGAGAEVDPAAGSLDAAGPTVSSGDMLTFADPTYGFEVNHPAEFVLSSVPGDALAQLSPTPVAGYRLMNPQTAASDIADLEPADLEIRVHALPAGAGLEQWLVANGFLPADGSVTPAPFAAANVEGVEVCASTMIAPGCSYFFAGGAYVYQLIPATLEGEEMMRSFGVAG